MFKKFWKAIIDFIKNVCRKVLEILAKPFGFKMNKANNSGGAGSGGGSSTRTEGSSSSNSPIDKGEGWTVLKELGHLLNSTIAYIKTPHDISREKISTVDGVNLPSLYNQSSIDTYDAFERFLGDDKVSGTGLKNVLSNIIEETKNLKFFDNKNSLESVNPKSLNMMGFAGTSYYDKAKVHSNISVKFEVPTADKEDDLKSLIAILNSATKVIENTMSCGSRTLSSLENLDKAANDKEVSDELAKLYSDLLAPSHMNNYSQGVDNGLTTFVKDDDKLYGIPIKHLIPLVSVYYIYSFGESNLTGILKKEDFISAVSAITAVTKYSDFKPENFESNGNVLKGTMFKDGDIVGKNLTTVEVKGGVPFTESPILEIPEYKGSLSISGEESAPTVEQHNFTGVVNVVASPMHDNNRYSKNEATMKQTITRIASSQRILKNETGSIQIQASEEVLKNVIGIQIQEVQFSDLSSLNYKAFDIKLKDVNGRYVKPEGKVLVTFATDQSVENVYAVDPEGKLHTIEFEQKDGKVIFEINNSSIYAMTFLHSIDNPPFKNPTEDNKAEELSLSPKFLSTNENSESNRLENKVSNNEQSMLPNTGETSSLLTMLFGFVGMILGVMISYKRKDS